MPKARTRSAVACPTQAIFTPEKARASRPNSLNFSHTARTALVEVNTTHWNRPSTRPLTARSIWAGLRGGSTAMVGTSIGDAPCDTSFSLISPAWSLVRGTSTVQPYSARLSHQFSFARLATVLPIVTTSGPVSGPAGSLAPMAALSLRPPSVVSTDLCWHVVPCAVTTHGLVSANPYSVRVLAASARCDAVACRISGPGAAASAAQSTSPRTSASVCVDPSGRPAYEGTAVVAGRPGTISNVRCERDSAFTSVITESTDRGSPATSRTTSTPVRDSVARVLATSAGSPSAGRMSGSPGMVAVVAVSPSPSLSVAGLAGSGPDGGGSSDPHRASTASGTSGSVKISAALASTVRARVVSRPGSPGPEPTNVMRPGLCLRPRVVICLSQLRPTDRVLPVRTTPRRPRGQALVPARES